MNVFIVEDEPLAVQKLSKLLFDVDSDIRISGIADGIESSIGKKRLAVPSNKIGLNNIIAKY